MIAPMTRARGRFFLASFSSAFIDVAIIQPSYAKAVAQTEASSGLPVALAAPTSARVLKLFARVPFAMPTTIPAIAMRKRGMSLIMVVDTWSLPASLGERALTA